MAAVPNVILAADLIATYQGSYVLVRRVTPGDPYYGKLALVGGKMDTEHTVSDGERIDQSIEETGLRELVEETGLIATSAELFAIRDQPGRDTRGRVVSVVMKAECIAGTPTGSVGETEVVLLSREQLAALTLDDLAFDHYEILQMYFSTHS